MSSTKLPIEVTKSLIGLYGREYMKHVPDLFTYNVLDKWDNIKKCLLLPSGYPGTAIELTCRHEECVEFISDFPYMFPYITLSDENIQYIDDIYIYIKKYLMYHSDLLVIDTKSIKSIITHSMKIWDIEFIFVFSSQMTDILQDSSSIK
jgi:hypothetical protein